MRCLLMAILADNMGLRAYGDVEGFPDLLRGFACVRTTASQAALAQIYCSSQVVTEALQSVAASEHSSREGWQQSTPLIMFATVRHVRSSSDLMFR